MATQQADISRGELNMCMVVIFDTLLLIIQSMAVLAWGAPLLCKCWNMAVSDNFMSSVTNKMKTCRTQHYHNINT